MSENINVISTKGGYLSNLEAKNSGGEQPIDVAYTIIALAKFFKTLDVIAINIIWKLLLAGFG
jgi:hypothetical protein